MKKRLFSILGGLFWAFALVIGLPFSVSAHTATTSQSSVAFPGCQQLELTLHGNGKPTSRCLTTSGSIQPLTRAFSCRNDGNDLVLYWNALPNPPATGNVPGGPSLCIRGQGSLDLSQGNQPDGRNWNDQASAWWAGCSAGHFDESSGLFAPGRQQGFSGGRGASAPSGNFDGVSGHLDNDTLTVVTLDSDC